MQVLTPAGRGDRGGLGHEKHDRHGLRVLASCLSYISERVYGAKKAKNKEIIVASSLSETTERQMASGISATGRFAVAWTEDTGRVLVRLYDPLGVPV